VKSWMQRRRLLEPFQDLIAGRTLPEVGAFGAERPVRIRRLGGEIGRFSEEGGEKKRRCKTTQQLPRKVGAAETANLEWHCGRRKPWVVEETVVEGVRDKAGDYRRLVGEDGSLPRPTRLALVGSLPA